jgi:predicted metal-dependent HD superfamily phosphohydrolase/endogenous inhibitor of DNA gyrase (YacG/DUF329 family)
VTVDLAARWDALRARAGLPPDREGFEDLERRWSEPHRRYHGLAHLRACLAALDACGERPADPAAAEIALWFHDAVYDTRAADNEERSADLLRAWAARTGFPAARAEAAASWVLATRHRPGEGAAGDGALVLDADLAILGEAPDAFADYERGVREEYAWVEEGVWRRERARVLRGLRAGPSLYRTRWFRDRYEEDARRNLAESLARLESPGSCPSCAVTVLDGSVAAPFCSPRCRSADLGRWFRGDYAVERPIRPGDVDPADDPS